MNDLQVWWIFPKWGVQSIVCIRCVSIGTTKKNCNKRFTKLISRSVLENASSVSIVIMSLERIALNYSQNWKVKMFENICWKNCIKWFTKLESWNVSENAGWVPIVSLPYQNSKGEVEQRREHRRESETEKRLFFVLFIILNKHKKP